MYIKLTKKRKYRGKEREAGEIITVLPALGERLILNGLGVEVSSNEEQNSNEDLIKLNKAELLKRAQELGLEADESLKKSEIIELIQKA